MKQGTATDREYVEGQVSATKSLPSCTLEQPRPRQACSVPVAEQVCSRMSLGSSCILIMTSPLFCRFVMEQSTITTTCHPSACSLSDWDWDSLGGWIWPSARSSQPEIGLEGAITPRSHFGSKAVGKLKQPLKECTAVGAEHFLWAAPNRSPQILVAMGGSKVFLKLRIERNPGKGSHEQKNINKSCIATMICIKLCSGTLNIKMCGLVKVGGGFLKNPLEYLWSSKALSAWDV